MSIQNKLRPPAWAGLLPNQKSPTHCMSNSWGSRLLMAIGRKGKILSHKANASRGECYFHFIPQDGSPQLFLKTLRSSRLDSQLKANRIVELLAQNALPVSPLISSYPRRIDNQYSLFAYRLIDGRFAQTSTNDLAALGRLLGRTHNVLKTLPWASQIRTNSASRNAQLAELRARALSLVNDQDPVYQAISQTGLALSDKNAQVIHGDLNIGNVLFGRSSGQPALLDLEDADHNWHNPVVDLATAIERFILVPEQDDDKAYDLGKALISGYKTTINEDPNWDQPASDILHILAARSLSLLLNSPHAIDLQEINKFVQLSQQATKREVLLRRLWEYAASK